MVHKSFLLCAAALFVVGALVYQAEGQDSEPSVVNAADYGTLQEAFDAIPASGGVVRLPPGRFEIREPLVLSRGDVRVEGFELDDVIERQIGESPGLRLEMVLELEISGPQTVENVHEFTEGFVVQRKLFPVIGKAPAGVVSNHPIGEKTDQAAKRIPDKEHLAVMRVGANPLWRYHVVADIAVDVRVFDDQCVIEPL